MSCSSCRHSVPWHAPEGVNDVRHEEVVLRVVLFTAGLLVRLHAHPTARQQIEPKGPPCRQTTKLVPSQANARTNQSMAKGTGHPEHSPSHNHSLPPMFPLQRPNPSVHHLRDALHAGQLTVSFFCVAQGFQSTCRRDHCGKLLYSLRQRLGARPSKLRSQSLYHLSGTPSNREP